MLRYFSTLVCAIVLLGSSVQAQNQRVVDSLHSVLECRSGGERFPALYDLAFEYVDQDNLKALQYIEEAEKAALLSCDSLWIVKSIRVRGQILYRLGHPMQAISILERLATRQVFIQFPREYFSAMSSMAGAYIFLHELDKALELHFKINRDAKESGTDEFIPMSLSNIGLVYYKLKDYRKALRYMKEGVSMIKNPIDVISMLMNISLCYSHLGDFNLARKYLDDSIEACNANCPMERMIHIKYASGFIHYKAGRFKQARAEFLESFDFSTQKKNTRMQLDNLYLLAKMSASDGQFGEARAYLTQAERIVQMGTPFNLEKIKIFEQLSQLYLATENFKRAAFYQSEYIRLKDSINNESVTARLMNIEAQHLESENHAKIAEQSQVIHLNQEIIKHQRRLNILYATVALLTIVILFFLLMTYCKKRTINVFLRKKIQERTCELEANRRELETKATQQKILLNRTLSGVSSALLTVRGLCLTARRELADPVARRYFENIDRTSSKVDELVQSVLTNVDISK